MMRSCRGLACLIAMMLLVEITPMSAGETALAEYQWENRLLLVFAPDADSALFRRQQGMLLGAEHGLSDRDMVIIFVSRDTVATKGRPESPASAGDLRDAYNIPPHDFQVVLIGKDGGVKLRQEEPISVADLFALIDSMPMRKGEMRKRSQ